MPLFLGYMLFPVSAIVLDSQLADIADQHELKTGYRSGSHFFSPKFWHQINHRHRWFHSWLWFGAYWFS